MRLTLSLVVLGSLFSAPIRAELLQATLTGHVTYADQYVPGSGWVPTPSVLGLSLGQTVQALLRYDTDLPPLGLGAGTLTPGPGGYGLTVIANGVELNPTGNLSVGTVPLNWQPPAPGAARFPAGLYLRNGLQDPFHPNLYPGLRAELKALDPQGQLFGPSVSTVNTSFPSPPALASYSPQGNASIEIDETETGSQPQVDIGIAVDSIAVNQAPEPSSLVLLGLGGFGLLGTQRRRRISFTC